MFIIWQKGNPPITIIRHEAPFILTNFMPIFQASLKSVTLSRYILSQNAIGHNAIEKKIIIEVLHEESNRMGLSLDPELEKNSRTGEVELRYIL